MADEPKKAPPVTPAPNAEVLRVQVIEKPVRLTSPNRHVLPKVDEATDPPLDMERIRRYRDAPTATTERYARELLTACGPLVLDEVQYRVDEKGKIQAIPRQFLGMDRQSLAAGLDKLSLETK